MDLTWKLLFGLYFFITAVIMLSPSEPQVPRGLLLRHADEVAFLCSHIPEPRPENCHVAD